MGKITKSVGLDNLPLEIHSRALPDADYSDLTTIATPDARGSSPEQWLRALLGEGAIGKYAARRLWRRLGLELGPSGSAEHVQGWRILDQGEDWIRIRTASSYMTAEAVLLVRDSLVSLALLLRFDKPAVAKAVWSVVGPAHRRGVPRMLVQAVTIRRAAHPRA